MNSLLYKPELVYRNGPLDFALSFLHREGYKAPLSLEDHVRLLAIEKSKIGIPNRFESHSWTREAFIYVPGEDKIRITKNSPILAHLEEATEAHRANKEFYIDSVPTDDLILIPYPPQFDTISIPLTKYPDEELTTFLLGAQAKDCNQRLGWEKEENIHRHLTINLASKNYVDTHPKPFVKQCSFIWPRNNFLYIDAGRSGNIYYTSGVLGTCPPRTPVLYGSAFSYHLPQEYY